MAKFLKKGSLGMMTEAPGGTSDPELAEIRLTPEEYFNLMDQIRGAKQAVYKARADADEREITAYREAQRKLELYRTEIQADAEMKIRNMTQALREAEEHTSEAEAAKEELEEALAKQQSLNTHLKRIARERANAKRGLTPKKQRTGYVVLCSSQYRQRYKDPDGKKCIAYTWKSTLQTPYDATVPLDTIEDDLWTELAHRILYPLGFRRTQDAEHNGEYRTWEEDDVELCGLYRWDYNANYKSGFWELTLYHTKGLIVPEGYRPSKY